MTLLSEQEQRRVAEAIRLAEQNTDAELVTVLARSADDYTYIPLLWAGLLALVLPGAINYLPGWLNAQWLALLQWGLFIVLALLFRLPPLAARLIPRAVRHWRGANMARRQFLEQGLHHTAGASGVLIFVSELEHYVEILVDRGVAERVEDAVWERIVAEFTARVRAGRTAEGFIACIEACGEQLRQALPATHDRDELPNHLVILD
ncbi:TPM domain-containing protein [Alkalilimnicola sp. S0819]|uniref:TPM domain-containing protein n=1 Tax=Alkalilimnicola sp. S0819 TaxID=2613922 RepID=UPI0012620849|nr:TPM domain-containing protein [Alkalilimnicola sp. S0819]KAB7619682.1 hypothetical protein F3N43_12940 [Alkalilimnicola sp. S0819]MPQ17539.1 hypothetical protein [Alkalilimnicola sp. S0819]